MKASRYCVDCDCGRHHESHESEIRCECGRLIQIEWPHPLEREPVVLTISERYEHEG